MKKNEVMVSILLIYLLFNVSKSIFNASEQESNQVRIYPSFALKLITYSYKFGELQAWKSTALNCNQILSLAAAAARWRTMSEEESHI